LVPLVATTLALDLATLPTRSAELRAGFGMGVGNNNRRLLVLYPGTDAGYEPQHIRYAVYMSLVLGDGTTAGNLGQLIVTGRRLVGMMTHGTVGGTKLNESVGSVFAFTIGLDDIGPPATKTRWTGRVAGVVIRSRQAHDPPFELTVTSVVGTMTDNGALSYDESLTDLIASLTPATRRRLLGSA